MMTLLSRLVGRVKKSELAHLAFTVYSREGCGCCHKAIELLKEQQTRYGFSIEVIDVDSDPLLVEEHGMNVPVVVLNGKVRFKGKINPTLLERLLLAESRGQ